MAVAAGAPGPSFSEYRAAQVAASLPTACAVVFVASFAYIAAELLVRPVQFHAALLPNAVQVSVPLLAWALVRTPLRRQAELLALGADLSFTLCLCLQLFIPESSTSGTTLFLAVKMLATALFFPWSARAQYASAIVTVALYYAAFFAADRYNGASGGLHQLLGPPIAALLATAGTLRSDRVRRELFRRDAEREELVARLQMILDRMPIGCLIQDAEFRYTYWNPAAEEIFGWRFEEVRGKHPFEVITPPTEHETAIRSFERLAAGEVLGAGTGRNRTRDGRVIVCEWKATPLHRRDGRFVGVLSMCQDVTVRQREAEARALLLEDLQAANRLKSDFVATMSHELRTPLNVMLGYNELLLEEAYGGIGEEQRQVLLRVGDSGRELLELINATLDVSRLEAGRVALVLDRVDLRDLLAQVRSETREAQRKPGLAVEWRVDEALPPILTDAMKLKMILKNLISNALKFTERGSVAVSAASRDGGVEIVVADTGIGMAPEALSIIFEPFRQVDGSSTRRHGGVGLGLYIVRRMADMLGARIEVESELGKGTTFRVHLAPAGAG